MVYACRTQIKMLPKEKSGPAGQTVLLRPVAHGPARLPLLKQGPARPAGRATGRPARADL